jgi:hypothetical protein
MESNSASEIWSTPSLEETSRSGLLKSDNQRSKPEQGSADLTNRRRVLWNSLVRLNEDWWLQELLAWVTGLGIIAGIFGILMTYHNRTLPEWPYSITINTALSLLALAAKGCLLVPIISALGQLKWIWLAERQHLLDSRILG